MSSCKVYDHGFGFSTPNLIYSSGFDLMVKIDLKIYKEFDRENRCSNNFTHLVIIHGQSPYKFSKFSNSSS